MLSPLRQEVLSALLNASVSFEEAEAVLRESSGVSFDDLYRVALSMLQAKRMKAAA